METVCTHKVTNTFVISSEMSQVDYIRLSCLPGVDELSKEEARAFVCKKFEFGEAGVEVLTTAQLYAYYDSEHALPVNSTIDRKPLRHKLLGRNYVRFFVGKNLFELIDDRLEMLPY